MPISTNFRSRLRAEASDERGSALLEFAVSLPLLVVFVVGIFDFSGAFNEKQKIAQAAQEGAILAAAQPTTDIYATTANPDSLQPVVTSVVNSLAGSGVLPNVSCAAPWNGTLSSTVQWTYTITGCSGTDNLVVTINRGLVIPGTPTTVGTQVTVSYPYHWRFNSVIQSLVPGASYAATTLVTETAAVHNQS